MKPFSTILFLFLSVNVFGQTKWDSAVNHAGLKVIHREKNGSSAMFYLNGKLMHSSLHKTLNPDFVADVDVLEGKIYIKTKADYKPQIISLNNLRKKYLAQQPKPALFMIDDEMVDGNYESILVDENTLLSIVTENFLNREEGLDLILIKLRTKSKENIKKSKEIMIRGNAI
ncbi:hypothetical protein E0F88_28145 [Dyadobacter psychrotolerans]|uniref:Uncharacterized protein n=2 Tax=Dyadobacter psychrotolerans TaxID=2541721 RepID=A0A4R5DAB5_9BACT|nr:hypothetical protein E0F88_28145 [Dyadobacter psychrotolerans]